MAATRLTFPRKLRLAHDRQYQAVYAGKVHRSRAGLGVTGAPNGQPFSRLGLSVGKRAGPAAARNRAKRIIREAFRLSRADLPSGLDLVVSVRTAAPLQLEPCREALVDMAASIAREWERREPRDAP